MRTLVSSAPAIAGEGAKATHGRRPLKSRRRGASAVAKRGGGGAGGGEYSVASGRASTQAPLPPRHFSLKSFWRGPPSPLSRGGIRASCSKHSRSHFESN